MPNQSDNEDRTAGQEAGRALVNSFLERFSQKVSAATGSSMLFGPLDEDGYAGVRRGSATVGINVFAEKGVLLFFSRIMPLPATRRAELMRRLLELNYLATAQAAFAIEKGTQMVCLRASCALQGLDYEEFETMLHSVAAVADEWDDVLLEEFGAP